jgi:hypothetical protein
VEETVKPGALAAIRWLDWRTTSLGAINIVLASSRSLDVI